MSAAPLSESTPSGGGYLIRPQYMQMTRADASRLFCGPKPKVVKDYRRGGKR